MFCRELPAMKRATPAVFICRRHDRQDVIGTSAGVKIIKNKVVIFAAKVKQQL